MAENTTEQSQVEQLADSFVARFRKGERPSISEYTQRYPDLAEEIKEVFPALVAIEQAHQDFQCTTAETSAAPLAPAISRLGDFPIIREIGRGGMGIVYEAEQVSLGRRVAVKVLASTLLTNVKNRKRFAREARAAAGLHHTNIVPVFGVGEQGDVAYYVMQLIHGLGLDDVLKEIVNYREASSPASKPLPKDVPDGNDAQVFHSASASHPAEMVLSGQFKQSILLQRDSNSSASKVINAQAVIEEPTAQPSAEPAALVDTVTGRLSDTISYSGSYALPGQGEETSKAVTRKTYWNSRKLWR